MKRLRLPANAHVGEYESEAYFLGRLGVFDVRPLNCIRKATGEIVPIDVIPRHYSLENSRFLESLTI
jgi:hypothetical protein